MERVWIDSRRQRSRELYIERPQDREERVRRYEDLRIELAERPGGRCPIVQLQIWDKDVLVIDAVGEQCVIRWRDG